MATKARVSITKVSEYVWHALLLGTQYRLLLGGPKGMLDSPIVTFRQGGEWVPCTQAQSDFIVRAIMIQHGPTRSRP